MGEIGSRTFCFLSLAVLLMIGATGSSTMAQEKPDSPAPKIQTHPAKEQSPSAAEKPDAQAEETFEKADVPKRIFFIIPNFMTTNDQPENQGPLSNREKFNIAWHQYWDVSAHFGNLVQAAISQGADSLPHYGQGWGPFGERFAAQEGDQFTGSMLIYGVLPSLLHQDPRYFRRGRGSAWSRAGYATSRVLIARTDSGKPTFNVSQVFGQLGQAGISLSYYPKEDRGVQGLFMGWAINQAYNIGWNQLKEFTPDLGAALARRSKKKHQEKEIRDKRSPLTPAG
jgi:hypothetical protein